MKRYHDRRASSPTLQCLAAGWRESTDRGQSYFADKSADKGLRANANVDAADSDSKVEVGSAGVAGVAGSHDLLAGRDTVTGRDLQLRCVA